MAATTQHPEGEEGNSSSPGFSILKDIFPGHGEAPPAVEMKVPSPAPCVLTQLLGSIPSPARGNMYGNGNAPAPNCMPFAPLAHAPMKFGAPAGPPPPPMMPAPIAAPQFQEAGFGSYRERLRAGGRGAFQRAFDVGLVPKNMKQDWNGVQMPSTPAQGMLLQSAEGHNCSQMSYDGSHGQMWNGTGQMQQSNDYCGYAMQAPQMQMQMLPQMAVQQPMQMMPMQQGEASPVTPQMAMPQPQMQMQLPPMAMSQPQTPSSSGYNTPTSSDSVRAECMAILMPQASQFFPCDQDLLAAQLRASAESQQRYED